MGRTIKVVALFKDMLAPFSFSGLTFSIYEGLLVGFLCEWSLFKVVDTVLALYTDVWSTGLIKYSTYLLYAYYYLQSTNIQEIARSVRVNEHYTAPVEG